MMLTYKDVTYFTDDKAGIAYFYNESRIRFCDECPAKRSGVVEKGDTTVVVSGGCPCDTIKMIPSASISLDAYNAIRDVGMFDEFIEEVKANDTPIGGGGIEDYNEGGERT